jgi:hypothetical protein
VRMTLKKKKKCIAARLIGRSSAATGLQSGWWHLDTGSDYGHGKQLQTAWHNGFGPCWSGGEVLPGMRRLSAESSQGLAGRDDTKALSPHLVPCERQHHTLTQSEEEDK